MAFLEIERLHKHYGPVEVLKEYNVHFAGAILAALPTLVVCGVSGRFFVHGLMAGAVKK